MLPFHGSISDSVVTLNFDRDSFFGKWDVKQTMRAPRLISFVSRSEMMSGIFLVLHAATGKNIKINEGEGGYVIKIPGRKIHECESGILQRVNWLWKLISVLNNYYHEADDVTEVMQSFEKQKISR